MNKICQIRKCRKPHKAKGFCNKHYRRLKAQGDPEKILVNHNMPDGESCFNWLFYIYKKNAERRKIQFKLSKEDFRRLTKQKCHYCGIVPSKIIKGKGKKGSYVYNGVDRVDSSKMYIKSNCVSCCTVCNIMKGKMDAKDFLIHVQMIHEHDLENCTLTKII